MARQNGNQQFIDTAFLYGGNANYIEQLQERFREEPRRRRSAVA